MLVRVGQSSSLLSTHFLEHDQHSRGFVDDWSNECGFLVGELLEVIHCWDGLFYHTRKMVVDETHLCNNLGFVLNQLLHKKPLFHLFTTNNLLQLTHDPRSWLDCKV